MYLFGLRLKFYSFILAILLSVSLCIYGGTDKKKNIKNNKIRFNINSGLTVNSGNTNSKIFNLGTKLGIDTKKGDFDTKFEMFYGNNKSQTIMNKGKWENSLSKTLSKKLNFYGEYNFDYDRVSNIKSRHGLGIGLQYVFAKNSGNRSKLVASVNYEKLNSIDKKSDKQSKRLNFNFLTERKFSENIKFFFKILYTPDIDALSEDYRVESEMKFSVLMTKPLWLTVKMLDKYNNSPLSETIKRNDFTLVTSLEFSI